jgi:hypothetical protein
MSQMATYEGGKHLLGVGDVLLAGDFLVSPDRTARAILQDDGNFVVYKKQPDGSEKIKWASHTYDGNTLGLELGAKLIVQVRTPSHPPFSSLPTLQILVRPYICEN